MKYLANVVTLRYSADRCTGCGRCWEVCPRGVFGRNGGKAFITDRDLCMECGACEANCAYGAVRVASGVGCASAVIRGALRGTEPDCGCGSQDSGCCG